MKKQAFLYLFTFSILLLFACNANKKKVEEIDPTNPLQMTIKNENDYLEEWKIIDSLDNTQFTKSAMEKVQELFAKVKSNNESAQIVKCLIYIGKYQHLLEEDGIVKSMNEISAYIDKASFPENKILESVLAEMYMQFFQNNSYKISNRTEIAGFTPEDIKTWTAGQFIDKANSLYFSSIDDDRIRQIPLQDYKAILVEGKHAEGLQPTLYDFLVYRAIDHFSNERTYLTQPAYQFYIDQDAALGDISTFINFDFESRDTSSAKLSMLHLFQKLLAFHQQSNYKEALVYANMRRLEFVYKNTVHPNKDTLYLETLKNLHLQYEDQAVGTEITYNLARYYFDKGDYITANNYCNSVINKFPEAKISENCIALQNDIKRKSLNFQTEQVNLPNEPILMHINYRNIPKLYGSVIKVSEAEIKEFEKIEYDQRSKYLAGLKPSNEFEVEMQGISDFKNHTAEYFIEPLPLGRYIVLLSDSKDIENKMSEVNYLITHVSNISFAKREDESRKVKFVLNHRKSGEPLQDVKVTFYEDNYNSKKRESEEIIIGETITDENGFAYSSEKFDKRFKVKFTLGDDHLVPDNSSYNSSRSFDFKPTSEIHFFLDREIYRPGQTVYFKGLLLKDNEKRIPEIIANEKVEIEIRDVNREVVEKISLRSNEYGTVNGFFTAPNNGITGQMSIAAKWKNGNDSKYFLVEDYKRPKFEVKFNPVKGSFKLGEEVSLSGNAKAYAGSNIDGAIVKYRVTRVARFPYFPWWRRGYFPPVSDIMEIKIGDTITDSQGNFNINFEAIPDLSVDPATKPEFQYEVSVDVIDITGETHSASQTVSIGYVALSVNLDVPELMNADSLTVLPIQTKNLNGEFEPAKGSIKIEKLQTPEKAYVERYWSMPEFQILSEEDFKEKFPHIAFKDENEAANWKIEKTVFEGNFDTEKEKELPLNVNFETGKYVLTLKSEDAFGAEVLIKKIITLYDTESGKVPSNESFFHVVESDSYQPGETAVWYFGSFYDNAKILLEVEHDHMVIESKWLTVNGLAKATQAINESHRGNLFYHIYFVSNNRTYQYDHTILVPWSNKKLNIEYGTFRDKLYPGQEETWQIKISGPEKEKVMAEMLAGMYDASLDAFAPNNWNLNIFPTSYSSFRWNPIGNGASSGIDLNYNYGGNSSPTYFRQLEKLNWFGFNIYQFPHGLHYNSIRRQMAGSSNDKNAFLESQMTVNESAANPREEMSDMDEGTSKKPAVPQGQSSDKNESDDTPIQVRTNLKETVFFFPNLKTDKEGNVIIQFTMNEALTRWKFMGLAHTKDLKIGTTVKEIVTQKDLMILPNPPRFFREGDDIEFTAKVSNLTEEEMNGTATLQLFDAISMEPLDGILGNAENEITFSAKAGQSDRLAWKLKIPVGQTSAITHRVVAKAGNFSDGEESSLPVLTNRMLVTETKPLPVRGNQTKDFNFTAMEKANRSNTLTHHKMTLEFTSNPAWYAVQALPYLMEYPYECIEQIFSRYYANALASSVANAHPKVNRVFEQWKGTAALESNLSKNQELKSALLEETPWVFQAQSEAQQKRNIGLLFDLNRMSSESQQAIQTIADRQLYNGGFAWFPGGEDSWYITQYIVEGMGHLDYLGVKELKSNPISEEILSKAISYIDFKIALHMEELIKRIEKNGGDIEKDHLDNMAIHYLYARSFFKDIDFDKNTELALNYYLGQAEKYWVNRGMYEQGMMALALKRFKTNSEIPQNIVRSFKERALNNDEFGMYWKYDTGYFWYQLPIETHALMIEVFDEIANDEQAVDDLKVWLLKNKQTTHWKTTKATAAAVYALLGRGDNWLLEDQAVKITLGDKVIDQSKMQTEAGTGYFKTSWDGKEIKNDMSQIKVENPNKVVAWGALYWQYFEQLDKIEIFEETPLTINKKLFKVVNSDTGPQMTLLTEGSTLSPGDKIHVRIELRVDRAMEYIHMKDMRAAGFEPINVISSYKWQGGLGYYESTRDAATNFFISYLPKGTYVFEYPIRVIHNGDFSNGITTIQCMYAPEFTSHSEGIRVKVGE